MDDIARQGENRKQNVHFFNVYDIKLCFLCVAKSLNVLSPRNGSTITLKLTRVISFHKQKTNRRREHILNIDPDSSLILNE